MPPANRLCGAGWQPAAGCQPACPPRRDASGRLRLLIVGYGNPIRSDDAVGYLAAERLRQVLTEADIAILSVHQLTPELAEPVSRAARVIFIDAAATGEPGAIEPR